MSWTSKVKEWFWLFVKILNTDVRELFQATKVVAQKESLSQLAERSKALGLEELPVLKEIRQAGCDHKYVAETQVWTRLGPKRFELQNPMICIKCDDQIISAIQPR